MLDDARPWPLGRRCSSGSPPRSSAPVSTACSAPPTCSRTCCCRPARRQGRHRVDEPGRPAGRGLRARRPLHGLRRRHHRRQRPRRRQDADPHRARRARHRAHPRGERQRCHRAGPARPDGDGRAVPDRAHRVNRVHNHLDPDSVIDSIHIAAGLGATSARTWLKLPVVDEMERVLDSTTLPCLLLGGDPKGDPADTYAEWGRGPGPSVRRRARRRPSPALFPPDGDVAGGRRRRRRPGARGGPDAKPGLRQPTCAATRRGAWLPAAGTASSATRGQAGRTPGSAPPPSLPVGR